MATKTRYTVRYRRHREGRTNYKKRLALLKGRKNRLVIRKTNTQIIFQIVSYDPKGDKVLLTTRSSELKKKGWKYSCKSIPAAYLSGLLVAKNVKDHKISEAVLDIGLQHPLHGNKLYSALKGVIDGGVNISSNEKVFPPEDRLSGKHIANYLEKSKLITEDFNKLKKELLGN